MNDAFNGKIVLTCENVQEAVGSDAFFEIAGLLLLNFHSPERQGVVETFKKVRKGESITFIEYEQLYSQLFDIHFMDICQKYFEENILGTKKTFEKISVDSIRVAFLSHLIQALVLGVVQGTSEGKERRLSGFGALEVYKTGGVHLVRDNGGEVHNLAYMMPTPKETDVIFFQRESKYVMFELSSGRFVSDDFSFHSNFDFSGFTQTGVFVNSTLKSQRLVSKNGKSIYETPHLLKFFPKQSVYIEGTLGQKNCFAIHIQGEKVEKYEIKRDEKKSSEEKEVFFYVYSGERRDIEIVLPPKKKFG